MEPVNKPEKDTGHFRLPAARMLPSVHAPFKKRRTVQPKVNNSADGHDRKQRKSPARRLRSFFERGGNAAGLMNRRFKHQQSDRSQNCEAGNIQNPFQGINTESVREWSVFLAGNQNGSNRLPGAPQ